MYSDRHLEFERIGKDTAAAVTRALPMGQAGLEPLQGAGGNTADVSPDAGLFLIVAAGPNTVATGLSIEVQHSDTETGTFATRQILGPSTAAADPGEIIFKVPCPQDLKNYARCAKFSGGAAVATPLNVFMTYDAAPKNLPTLPN